MRRPIIFWAFVSSLIGWVTLWYLTSAFEIVDSEFLTPPGEIVLVFWELVWDGYAGATLIDHFLISLYRTLFGFIAAILTAVPLGLVMGMNRTIYFIFNPLFAILRPIPTIAFIPLVILWFGIGETSKILLIYVAAFLFIVLNTYDGVLQVPIKYRRVAENLGATPFQMFWRVILPGAAPSIMTGVKVGLAISWAVVVAAELVAAQKGLGYIIMDAATFYRIPVVYIGVLCIGIVGMALEMLVAGFELRFVHWRGR